MKTILGQNGDDPRHADLAVQFVYKTLLRTVRPVSLHVTDGGELMLRGREIQRGAQKHAGDGLWKTYVIDEIAGGAVHALTLPHRTQHEQTLADIAEDVERWLQMSTPPDDLAINIESQLTHAPLYLAATLRALQAQGREHEFGAIEAAYLALQDGPDTRL